MSTEGKIIRRFRWVQRAILVVDAVLCGAIVAVSALAILGDLSLMVAPLNGFDGSPLPAMYLVAPAIALVAGLVAACTSTLALLGQGLRRRLLLISLAVLCLLYVIEAMFHVVNIGEGGSLAFAAALAGVSALWWFLNLAFARAVEKRGKASRRARGQV